jgi:hypothetical protein
MSAKSSRLSVHRSASFRIAHAAIVDQHRRVEVNHERLERRPPIRRAATGAGMSVPARR